MADQKNLPPGLRDYSLAGKAALVVGAEHPVGRVAALTLAEAGANVMLASQDVGADESLKQAAKAAQALGVKAAVRTQRASIRADLAATADRAVAALRKT
jgi:NAD(P)-dependent dehydrogenase (short-subunit alcohol dehydrogenase family)